MSTETRQASELLPEELSWAAGGHASDIVLTALADGQVDIVPASVRSHVERCTTCTMHLGNAALLSLHTRRELATAAAHARSTERRPLPRLAIVLGIATAVLGMLPSLVDGAPGARAFASHRLPLLARGIAAIARPLAEPSSMVGMVATYAAAALLVAMGIVLVRLLPQKETPR